MPTRGINSGSNLRARSPGTPHCPQGHRLARGFPTSDTMPVCLKLRPPGRKISVIAPWTGDAPVAADLSVVNTEITNMSGGRLSENALGPEWSSYQTVNLRRKPDGTAVHAREAIESLEDGPTAGRLSVRAADP
ncbi:protein of unknown function [Magnetospirillum sp. XM-1]|nr:protein of unknown function [Magnetospirillum sp. XM-1]